MTNLEFIEKEIEKLKELLELDDVLCLQTDEDYKFWYDRLKMFQQIKLELEAWEVVKDKTMGNDYLYEIVIYKSEKDDYKKFEKALEAKGNG